MAKETLRFIGIDLADPFAKHERLCTRAILEPDLHCTFGDWIYDETGSAIVPPEILQLTYILAIDGPQGLAASPEQRMRACEQQLGVAGKSPYDLPPIGHPYAGFVRGSVKLFYSLYKSGGGRLFGMQKSPSSSNLIEVYPGSAWFVLADGCRLAKKRSLEGRKARYALLARQGLSFPQGYSLQTLPTHDQLDAAVAAYIAYLFKKGKTSSYGRNPFEDPSRNVLREGLIVQPAFRSGDITY